MEGLELGIGDMIQVYKANMIIPQVAENLTKSGICAIPEECPVCKGKTQIKEENDVKVLICTNPDCLAKKIKAFTHFVGRDAMNIEGLSEATIEKLIAKGFVSELADLFHLEKYEEEITKMDGFGKRSFANLITSINRARTTTPAKFIFSLGILNIGLSTAKLICKEYKNDITKVLEAKAEDLTGIEGVGEVIANTFVSFFEKENNKKTALDVLEEIQFEPEKEQAAQVLDGKTFVITGSLTKYENRNVLKEEIERLGGKVSGSVSSKTNYLINNDNTSNSSKNKKARELNIPVITEEEFIALLQEVQGEE